MLTKKEIAQRQKHRKQMNEFHNEFQSLLQHAFNQMKTFNKQKNNEKNKS